MWNKATMTFGESVIISLMGLSVVFLALIVLALAVYLISLILRTVSPVQEEIKASDKGAAGQTVLPAKEPPESEDDQELLAALSAAIADDLGLSPDKFRIKSIQEI